MNNDRYPLVHRGAEPIKNVFFMHVRKTAWCVQENELETIEVETGKRVYQGIELLKPKGGKFDDRNGKKSKARQR
jgi:hypothetical protein